MKTEQAVKRLQVFPDCVVNVNSTFVFRHFKDLKDLIILNILKEKLVMSCLLGSCLFETYDVNDEMFREVPPFFEISRFCYYFFYD